MKFLKSLKRQNKKIKTGCIIFHNDTDGFFSAIMVRDLLKMLGYQIASEDMHATTHMEIEKIKHDPDKIYLYVDIQPQLFDKNIYCIDHHMIDSKAFKFSSNIFIYSPDNIEREFPTTSALLVVYLRFVHAGGSLKYEEYVNKKIWTNEEFTRLLVLLCTVADNLWLLSTYSKSNNLRDWILEFNLTERKLIKSSMALSVLLGTENERERIIMVFAEKPIELINENFVNSAVESISVQIDNLFKFGQIIVAECEQFAEENFQEVGKELERIEDQIKRKKETIRKYRKAMPIGLKQNTKAIMEMVETVGDRDKPKWKQIEFYGNEIERLETSLINLRGRLDYYQKKKFMISSEIQGICLFIGHQSSDQVKGILSSLLFYFGFKNIVIEEFEHYAVWGARGFSQDALESELTTLTFDKHMLDMYRIVEDVSKTLPKTYQRSLNISQNVTFDVRYIGGMGGRGMVYGGNITGKVPMLFAFLEAKTVIEIENKLRELIKHGQLSTALKGLTEGESAVPTAHALRSKFKSKNWITVQMISGPTSGDILQGDLGMVITWLVGKSKELQIPLIKIDPYNNNNTK